MTGIDSTPQSRASGTPTLEAEGTEDGLCNLYAVVPENLIV
jgi:hypothetical protein